MWCPVLEHALLHIGGDNRRCANYHLPLANSPLRTLQASSQDQVLTSLFVAFSRLASKKDYVQHHVLVQAAAVYQALEANGLFYVCGDAKHMAKDVHRALHDVIQASRKCSTSEAEAYVKALQTSGRYMQDVW